jgi:Tfp pilus assembly protein PilX
MKQRQHGIATLVTLVALLVMLIAAVALIRSTNVSQIASGNLAFRRDITNRGEQAASVAYALFSTGYLAEAANRLSNSTGNNYSATTLATDAKSGLPSVLLNDTTFASNWTTSADIVDATNGIKIRYIIDRMCSATGAPSKANCSIGTLNSDTGGTQGEQKAGGTFIPVYRLSVRITGPKNTMTFLQTTFQE